MKPRFGPIVTPPREPVPRRYFPGWTMVGVSAAAQFLSAPGQSYSVAAFKEPMRESLEVSETSFSFAYAAATILSGCLVPLVGRALDRWGARVILPSVSGVLGLACLGMSQVDSLKTLYFGFAFVRSLGQGALSLIAAWMVGEWFERRRGFATALSGLGGSFSVMLIPMLNAYVIFHYGWQAGWIVLAVAVWALLTAPSLFLVRNRPEDLGLLPDGDPPATAADGASGDTADSVPMRALIGRNWQVREVLSDPTFWKLLSVPASSGMIGTGLIFHAVSLLGSRGVSADRALLLISLQALVATVAAVFAGMLTDRCAASRLLAAAMIMLAAASGLVLWLPTTSFALLYAVLLGLHGSIIRSAGTVVWLDYYGRQHQGAIRGIAMAVMILAAAAGPLPLALAKDLQGSYDAALACFIALPLGAAVLVGSAQAPERGERDAEVSAPGGGSNGGSD